MSDNLQEVPSSPPSLWARIETRLKVMSNVQDTAYPSFNFPRLTATAVSFFNFLKDPSAHFKMESAEAFLMPFAAAIAGVGLFASVIKLMRAENKKDLGTLGNLAITATKFLLGAVGLIGSAVAGASFGAVIGPVLTAGAALSAVYNLGLAIGNAGFYAWAKASGAEASAEKYKDNAKHYAINFGISSAIAVITGFLTITKIAPVVFTVLGTVAGVSGMGYGLWKTNKEMGKEKQNTATLKNENSVETENTIHQENEKNLSAEKLKKLSCNGSTRLLSQTLKAPAEHHTAAAKNDSVFSKWDYYENKDRAAVIDKTPGLREQQIYLFAEAVTRFNFLEKEPVSIQRDAEMSMIAMLLKTLKMEDITTAIPGQVREHRAFKSSPDSFSALSSNKEYKEHAKNAAQSWKKMPESKDLHNAFARHAAKQKEHSEKTEPRQEISKKRERKCSR